MILIHDSLNGFSFHSYYSKLDFVQNEGVSRGIGPVL